MAWLFLRNSPNMIAYFSAFWKCLLIAWHVIAEHPCNGLKFFLMLTPEGPNEILSKYLRGTNEILGKCLRVEFLFWCFKILFEDRKALWEYNFFQSVPRNKNYVQKSSPNHET